MFRYEKTDVPPEVQFNKQLEAAAKDLLDKLTFIYNANTGKLDKNGNTIRFRA